MSSFGIAKIAKMLSIWSVVVNTLAALAAVSTVALDGALPTVLLALIPLLIIMWRQRRALLRAPGRVGGIGRYVTARYLLMVTAVVQLNAIDRLEILGISASLLLVIAIALEPVLSALSRFSIPYAANMPSDTSRPGPAFRYGIAYPLGVAAVLVMILASLAPTPLLILALVLALATAVALAVALLDTAIGIRDRLRFQEHLPQILEELAPVFYVYWHAPPKSAFQVTMWLPYLERLGVPFVLVTRTVPSFRQLRAATDHPVILRRSLTDLDDLIVPSARGVFYVNNAMRNNHMIRYSQLTHIQLLHGESDKAASATPIIRMYDRDFVAGQAAIDRFETFGVPMPREIFRIVGRPQVEDVAEERGPIGELPDRTVLYAPTWLGYQEETNYSSLLAGPEIVRSLLDRGCRVVFRPHPYSSRSPQLREASSTIREMLAADAEASGREHLFGEVAEREMSVVDCFNASDAMISDVSAVVGDFLHSGKPLGMVSPRTGAEEFVEQFPMARAAYVLVARDGELEGLESTLDRLLETDPHREERHRWATYYLGDIPRENYAQRFVDTAREELGIPAPDAEPLTPQVR